MIKLEWKKLRSLMLVGALAATTALTLVPVAPAAAQSRALPDFTDLVEQVGPSVVNIRTLEKVSPRQGMAPGMDEDMLEFFRRYGIPMPNIPRQAPRPNRDRKSVV